MVYEKLLEGGRNRQERRSRIKTPSTGKPDAWHRQTQPECPEPDKPKRVRVNWRRRFFPQI
jgi:hypothetical protein